MKSLADRLTFYKELYYKETERRKDFNNAISVPIALLTGVFSILFFTVSAYDFSGWGPEKILFLTVVIISFILFTVSGFHTVKFYANIDAGFKTLEIPGPANIEKYRTDLLDFHQDEEETEKKLTEWLIKEYIASGENYQKNNDLKSRHFFQFKKYFIYGMTTLLLSGSLFMINFITDKKNEGEKLFISIEIPASDYRKEMSVKKDTLKNDSLKITLTD